MQKVTNRVRNRPLGRTIDICRVDESGSRPAASFGDHDDKHRTALQNRQAKIAAADFDTAHVVLCFRFRSIQGKYPSLYIYIPHTSG